MLRFSLASLLGLVLIAAVGSAALANATEIWRQTMVTVSVTILLVATLAALVRRGKSQAFALGFAMCGWIYLLLVFVSALGLRDDLLTDKAVRYLFATIHEEDRSHSRIIWPVAFSTDPPFLLTGGPGDSTARIWDTSTGQTVNATVGGRKAEFEDFSDIGHSLWVITVGFIGGLVAVLLCKTERYASVGSRSAP